MWRSGNPIMKRCHWVIRRQILVTDVALNALNMLLVTDQGEAFIGYPSGKKSGGSSYRDLKDSKKGWFHLQFVSSRQFYLTYLNHLVLFWRFISLTIFFFHFLLTSIFFEDFRS